MPDSYLSQDPGDHTPHTHATVKHISGQKSLAEIHEANLPAYICVSSVILAEVKRTHFTREKKY